VKYKFTAHSFFVDSDISNWYSKLFKTQFFFVPLLRIILQIVHWVLFTILLTTLTYMWLNRSVMGHRIMGHGSYKNWPTMTHDPSV